MKSLFGKLLVTLGYKFKMPIFVVYYGLWALVGLGFLLYFIVENGAGAIPDLIEEVIEVYLWFFAIFGGWFLVLMPLAWHFTTQGLFWKVPDDETMGKLFPNLYD